MHASVLKYFCEVAKYGSMRKAAQHLFIAPSAINRQIRNLEDELSVELFERLPGGLKLTPAGERLLMHARRTLDEFHAMRSEFDALRGVRTGHISLVGMDSAMEKLIPQVLHDFGEVFPAVTYSVQCASISRIAELVASGEFNIGIGFCQKGAAGARVAASAKFRSGVVMAASHPLAMKTELTFDDCRSYRILRSGSDDDPNVLSPEYMTHWEQTTVHVHSNSLGLLKSMIVAGRGIAFFTKMGFLDELECGSIVWRPLSEVSDKTPEVVILVQAQNALSSASEEFLNRLIRVFRQFEVLTAD